jgi:hypothetical protein
MNHKYAVRTPCLAGILTVAVLAWGYSTASAQYCGGWGAGCGINYPYGLYGSRVDEVPYFSMFPPVYYSMPVPRTYGWSPFAYPPGTMTPEVAADGPEDIINPYVPQNKEAKPAKPTSARTAAFHPHTPQMLVNQFVSAEGTTSPASTQIARK